MMNQKEPQKRKEFLLKEQEKEKYNDNHALKVKADIILLLLVSSCLYWTSHV